MDAAFYDGYRASVSGIDYDDNPYNEKTQNFSHERWNWGWSYGHQRNPDPCPMPSPYPDRR